MNYTDEEELKKAAPHLFTIEKKEVFVAPENYFEKLPGLMQDKVHAGLKPKSFWVPDYKLAFAVVTAGLLLFSGLQFLEGSKNGTTELASSEIAQDYDTQYLASADEQELAEQLDDESLESTSIQLEENNGLSNQEIEDYLINNNIELTTISNEF